MDLNPMDAFSGGVSGGGAALGTGIGLMSPLGIFGTFAGAGGMFGDPFDTSASPINSNQLTGSQGETLGLNQNFMGTNINLMNPGSMGPGEVNPYANQVLQNNQNLYGMFQNSAAGGAFNPNFYNQLKNSQQQQITSSMGNQYAAMGLSGSSAEMGGMANAVSNNQMNWLNRQQSDQMRAMQGLSGMNQQMYGDIMGIQNQYGNYEDTAAQSQLGLLGLQQQQRAANQQLEGQIVGGLLGGAGSAIGAFA